MAHLTTETYTIVQHSGAGYGDKTKFNKGLETRMLRSVGEYNLVTRVKGKLFNNYNQAEEYAEEEMYKHCPEGIYPCAPGTFSTKTIDDLKIYIP